MWYTVLMQSASIKRIVIICAVALTATLVWATAKPWLENPLRFSGYAILLWPSLALVLASAVAGLAWMMLDSKTDRFAAILASWASFVIFWSPDIWYVSMLPLFALLWHLSATRIRDDLSDRHTIRIRTSLGAGLTPLMLGTFLMLSLGFYLLPAYHNVGASEVSVGLQGQLTDAYDNPLVVAQLNQLPPSMRAQVKADLSKNVDAYVKRFLGPLDAYVPPLLAFALFLVLWSVLFIYRELAIWFGLLLFRGLVASGFVRIVEKDVKAETLSLV